MVCSERKIRIREKEETYKHEYLKISHKGKEIRKWWRIRKEGTRKGKGKDMECAYMEKR